MAQPLVQSSPLLRDSPLTTLLQPQKLDRSRPLLPQAGEGAGRTNVAGERNTPCARPLGVSGAAAGRAKPGAAPSVYGGGSGPGDYGRFLPSPPSASGTASATPARPGPSGSGAAETGAKGSPSTTAGVDRPLYGGTDRPLWDTGDRRAAAGAASRPAAGTPAQPAGSDPARAESSSPASAPGGVSTPGRDRPLWADGSLMASAEPSAGAGVAAVPCVETAPSSLR